MSDTDRGNQLYSACSQNSMRALEIAVGANLPALLDQYKINYEEMRTYHVSFLVTGL